MPVSTRQFLRQNASWLGAGAMMMFLSSFGQTFFISIFAAEIQTTFDLSHGEWGSLYGFATFGSALAMIWAGTLTDRYKARLIGAVCLLGLGISCLMMAFNPWAAALPVVIFCLRFTGQGMVSHVATVSMTRWFVATRGRALATAGLGYSLGEMVLPLLFVTLMAFVDWHTLWIGVSALCLFAAMALQTLLKTERQPGGSSEDDSRTGLNARHWTRSQVLRHPVFWTVMPAFVGLPAFGTAVLFHQVHYAETVGISHFALVSLFPLYSVSTITAMVAWGLALDRFGTIRLAPLYPLPLVVAFALFGLAQDVWQIALAFVFFAVSTGAAGTLLNALWAELYGTRYIGGIKAMAAAGMVLGSAIGPAVTGEMLDAGIGLGQQYICVALYFLGASLVLSMGMRRISGIA